MLHDLSRFNLSAVKIHHGPTCAELKSVEPSEGSEAERLSTLIITRTLDVLGFHCPVPVHESKRCLMEMKPGQSLFVMADDPETMEDIPMMCNRYGWELISTNEEAGEYHYLIHLPLEVML